MRSRAEGPSYKSNERIKMKNAMRVIMVVATILTVAIVVTSLAGGSREINYLTITSLAIFSVIGFIGGALKAY